MYLNLLGSSPLYFIHTRKLRSLLQNVISIEDEALIKIIIKLYSEIYFVKNLIESLFTKSF